jgi:hypothetical protein
MVTFVALLFCAIANAAPPSPVAIIESVEGTGQVTLVRGGKSYATHKADSLYEADELRTTEKVAARISYKDGSRQIMASKTRLKIHVLAGGVPAPEFIEGAVESEVPPASKPSGKPRFFFRAKSVVLGVRGTEFVVHTGPKGLEVHTLKGVVEAVSDERDLGTPKAIQINQAFEVVGISGTRIPTPSAFVPQEFLGKLAQKYPEVAKLLKEK